MRFLFDTNVLSEIVRRRPDRKVVSWLVQHEPAAALSELTIAELLKGAFRLPEGIRRRRTLQWIDEIEARFQPMLLPLDLPVLKRWAELSGTSETEGHRLPVIDSLLAATALVHDLTLVTRNTADFPPALRIVNPWSV